MPWFKSVARADEAYRVSNRDRRLAVATAAKTTATAAASSASNRLSWLSVHHCTILRRIHVHDNSLRANDMKQRREADSQ